ncbi:MAG: ankyrin repeat domain-containing protein [Candidatus Aminicenantales bacterium]
MTKSKMLAVLVILISGVFLAQRGGGQASAQELLDAVRAGDVAGVKALVEKNPKIVNEPNRNGATILFAAVGYRRLEIAEYLISKGADVNVRNNFQTTPLHLACGNGLPAEFIKLLTEKGADVNAVAKYSGTPLDLALDARDTTVIDFLKSKGARSTPLEFETFRLADGVRRIAYPWGMRNNIVVFSGPDGILLVDTGFSRHAVDALRRTIAGLAKGKIRYVINTHPHGDHVDGNGVAPAGAAVINATVLESPDLKDRISRGDRPLRGGAGRELATPFIMRFNGEDIQIVPNPGLHSPTDILVYFPKSKVVCMGDLLLSQNCPAVQDVAGYMDFIDKVLDVFPPGTTFVSGHGKDLTMDGLVKYRDDLAAMIAVVRKNYAAGRSAEEMLRDDVLKDYKAAYSFLDWIGPDSWLERVCQALQSGTLR